MSLNASLRVQTNMQDSKDLYHKHRLKTPSFYSPAEKPEL